MRKAPLDKQVIISRLEEIEKAVEKLRSFQTLSLEQFKQGENFAIAEHYLRRALEAALEIGSHILARLPGEKPRSYRDIPRLLGENGIIPRDFANQQLTQMAGYRNRLIHFYQEVTVEEMHSIIKEDLGDLDKFAGHIGAVLKNPQQFNLDLK